MRVVFLCAFFVLAAVTAEAPRGKQNFPILRGVNKAGTEYQCIKGYGFFDGGHDDNTVLKMKDWRINAVRVPLNENCWLGEYVKEEYAKENYKKAIKEWVDRLRSHGMYVILELHWTEGLYKGEDQANMWDGTLCYEQGAKCQKPMPDFAKAPLFWKEVAETFKHDENIIFDLFNEPYPDRPMKDNRAKAWKCWRNGHDDCKPEIGEYEVAGMQDLVNAVRETGAKNLIMIGGLAYSNDLDGWMDDPIEDSENNIAASMHSYNFNGCVTEECWEKGIGKISEKYPVIVGEIGENDCKHKYIDEIMPYLDKKGISYLGWNWNAWNKCEDGPNLIQDDEGTPTPYGEGYKKHLEKFTPVYSK